SAAPGSPLAVGLTPYSVAIADVNGDGKPDLLTPNYTNDDDVSVLLGTGAGSFSAAPSSPFVGVAPDALAVAELNGDGKPHPASSTATRGANRASVERGPGTGSSGAATHFAVGAVPCAVTIGDLNNDGKPDLVVCNANTSIVSVLLGTGTGSFAPAVNFAVGV